DPGRIAALGATLDFHHGLRDQSTCPSGQDDGLVAGQTNRHCFEGVTDYSLFVAALLCKGGLAPHCVTPGDGSLAAQGTDRAGSGDRQRRLFSYQSRVNVGIQAHHSKDLSKPTPTTVSALHLPASF